MSTIDTTPKYLAFDNGPHPIVSMNCASSNIGYVTPQQPRIPLNDYAKTEFYGLTFNFADNDTGILLKPHKDLMNPEYDVNKIFSMTTNSFTYQGATLDAGQSTWEFIGGANGAVFKLPCKGDITNYGTGHATSVFTPKWNNVVLYGTASSTHATKGTLFTIPSTFTFACNRLEITSACRLIGSSATAPSYIKTSTPVVFRGGTWGFTRLRENFYISDGGSTSTNYPDELLFPENGGTGLSSVSSYGLLYGPSAQGAALGVLALGSADEILSVNAAGNAIEWAAAGGGSGDITAVVAGDGLTGGATSGSATINIGPGNLIDVQANQIDVDLSELTDGTADVVGSADELVYLDAGSQKRKQIDEIKLGQFNNDQGWTANAGDITGVTAGVGLSGGGSSGGVTLTLDLSELSTVTPADGDFFSTLDSDGANEQKTSTTALATLFAGAGLTATSSVIANDVIGKHTIWVPAAAMRPTASNGCSVLTVVETSVNVLCSHPVDETSSPSGKSSHTNLTSTSSEFNCEIS